MHPISGSAAAAATTSLDYQLFYCEGSLTCRIELYLLSLLFLGDVFLLWDWIHGHPSLFLLASRRECVSYCCLIFCLSAFSFFFQSKLVPSFNSAALASRLLQHCSTSVHLPTAFADNSWQWAPTFAPSPFLLLLHYWHPQREKIEAKEGEKRIPKEEERDVFYNCDAAVCAVK